MTPQRKTSPPANDEMKISSSGVGMSKVSPYISCSRYDDRVRQPAAIGWDWSTVQMSSRSPSLRHISEFGGAGDRWKIFE